MRSIFIGLLFVVFVLGTVSQNNIQSWTLIEQEDPFNIDVLRFSPERGIIEYQISISNRTSVKADGQLHFKNENGRTLEVKGFWIDDAEKIRNGDYEKGQQFINVMPQIDLTVGKFYNVTLKYTSQGDERISLIWGTSIKM